MKENIPVIILCGGLGTRMGELTDTIPKPLLRIGEFPILYHIMRYYASYGFNEFILPLGYKGWMIRDYFINFVNHHFKMKIQHPYGMWRDENRLFIENEELTKYCPWDVTFIDTGETTLTGSRVSKALREYSFDNECKDVMVTYGDGLADVNLKELLEFHQSHNKVATMTGVKSLPRFGEIQANNTDIVSFSEKKSKNHTLINGGFLVFKKEILKYLPEEGDYALEGNPMLQLVKNKELKMYKHEGNWSCVDNPRELAVLNELWKNQKAFWWRK